MHTDLFALPPVPGSPALPPEQVADLLRRAVPELALGAWTLQAVEPLRTLRHGGQRLTDCVARWTDHCDDSTRTAGLVIKQNERRDLQWADWVARLLAREGMGAGACPRVATAYGACLPGTGICERVEGHSLQSLLLGADSPAEAAGVGERLAGWLLALQRVAVPLPTTDRRGLSEALPQLVEVADQMPGAGRPLRRLAWELSRAAATPAQEPVAAHGDLHPGNVFATSGGTGGTVGIDWDTAGGREPAYDVGYALAHLVISPLRAGAPLEHLLAATSAFWSSYVDGGGRATQERVAVQAARAFVQSMHFELVTYANGRRDVLDVWTRAALALLAHGPDGLQELADVEALPGAPTATATGTPAGTATGRPLLVGTAS